jgi:hypothetical protein
LDELLKGRERPPTTLALLLLICCCAKDKSPVPIIVIIYILLDLVWQRHMELPSHMDPGFFLYFVATRMTATRGGCYRHDDTKKLGTQKRSSRSAPNFLLFLTVGVSFRVSGT